jgi:ABC-2 type transport system permease protein
MSPLALVAHEFRFAMIGFRRNRQARFFTLLLPIVFLVLFAAIFGNQLTFAPSGTSIRVSTYYVPHIVALGVISASFMNLVITIVTQRESGTLKRRRATPVPAWVLITARAGTALVISIALVVVLIAIGRLAYGVRVPGSPLVGVAVAVIVGSLAFCCLGYAVASAIGSFDAAQPVALGIMLPLYFISGIFVPDSNIPLWLQHVADFFPVRHLGQAVNIAFDPNEHGLGLAGSDLLVLAAWGAGGLAVALWRFSWVPRAAGR